MRPQEIQRVLSETLRPECPIDARTSYPPTIAIVPHTHFLTPNQNLPVPDFLYETPDRATLCLTIAVLLGSVRVIG